MHFRSQVLTHVIALAVLGMAGLGVAAAQKPEFQYAIEVAADRASDGALRVQPDHIFRSGDRFRVAFASRFNAFVYLFARGDAESSYTRLFPHEAIEASNLVRPNYEVRVPDGGGWLALDDRPGLERLVMVISNRRQPDLEEAGSEVERDRLNRTLSQLHLTRSRGNVRSQRQKDGWTKLRFEGNPQRIVHVMHLSMMHHTR